MKKNITIKKAISFLISAVILFSMVSLPLSVSAAPGDAGYPILTFDNVTDAIVGDMVEVGVYITALSSVATLDMQIKFDRTKLDWQDGYFAFETKPGKPGQQWVVAAASPDYTIDGDFRTLNFAGANPKTGGTTAGGLWFTIYFEVLSGWTGTTPLVATITDLQEGVTYTQLPYQIINGSVSTPAVSTTVTFDSYGGSAVPAITQNSGTTIATAPVPTKANNTFDGWYTDAMWTNLVAFPYTLTASNVTFYAKWILNSYTITWNAAGGSGGGINSCDHGATPAPISAGTKAGYNFVGWTPELAPATQDTTYTAVWEVITFTITFNENGGIGGGPQTVNFGEMPAEPTVTKAGYVFYSWNTEVVAAYADATYTAVWYMRGDINGDDKFTSTDALMALQASTGEITLSAMQMLAADVNGSGTLSAIDALMILHRASGKITSFDQPA